ncbi:MAG: class I SAM-dependent methyltransferase [Chloroflexi bacterium]|nr:class I SAM-dependent methyltransferase [Chloroflexota bacterium]
MSARTDHFDDIAEQYDQSLPGHVARHYLEKRVRFVSKLLRGGCVLDIGCGTGALAHRLREAGYEVAGLDPSRGMLTVMAKRDAALVSVQGAAQELPFKSGSFDLVLCVAVLHHIADMAKVADTISEMVRVTKVGGKVIVWDHNPLNPYWPIIMGKVAQDTGGERLIPLEDILQNLRRSGETMQAQVWRLGWMPDFAPRFALPVLKALEAALETAPLIRNLSAHNVVVATKGEP